MKDWYKKILNKKNKKDKIIKKEITYRSNKSFYKNNCLSLCNEKITEVSLTPNLDYSLYQLFISTNLLETVFIPKGWKEVSLRYNPLKEVEFENPSEIYKLYIDHTLIKELPSFPNLIQLYCDPIPLYKPYLGISQIRLIN